MLLVSHKISFRENEAVTMRNFAEKFYLYKSYNMTPEVLTQIS